MISSRGKLYQSYHILLSMALSGALLWIINQYFILQVPAFLIVFFSFLVTLAVSLIAINRRYTVTYLIIIGFILILALGFRIRKFNPIPWIKDFIDWLFIYNGTEELYRTSFAYFTVILVCGVSALLFFLLNEKQSFKIILAAAIFGSMIFSSISGYEIDKAAVAVGIFYCMSVIIEEIGIIYAKKAGKQEKKESILYLAPVCLLLAVLSVSIPSSQEPFQWKTVKLVYHTMKENIQNCMNDLEYYFSSHKSEFYISLTGYSDESGELRNKNGKLVKDDKVAMNINGSDKKRAVYLTGSVSDIYTGYSWEKSYLDNVAGKEDYILDYLELAYALARQEPETLENHQFVERETFKVQFDNIKTKTFFYPLKTGEYEFLKKNRELLTQDAGITFTKVKGRGLFYETTFYDMNLQGEAFIAMLIKSDGFCYDNPPELIPDSLVWMHSKAIMQEKREYFKQQEEVYEQLKERSEQIKRYDTVLPETLPQRVKNLAYEITKDYDTTYDKLKAIESYLQGYTYTMTPDIAPEDRDFVDYFLFDSKEGYCTSYATAMAVLGRCIGVPTRYVEGFRTKFIDRDDNNMYPVRNSQAHAWAEAYFNGIGWIPFEATAGFYDSRYPEWIEPVKQEYTGQEAYYNPYETMMPENTEGFMGMLPPVVSEEKEKTNELMYGLLLAASAVFILIFLFFIYYGMLIHHYRRSYCNADTGKKMYMRFIRILALLKQAGFGLQQQETILMLSDRVKNYFEYGQVDFPELAEIYMRYRYAQEKVTDQELKRFLIYEEGLTLMLRANQSGFKFWMREVVFLMKNHDN